MESALLGLIKECLYEIQCHMFWDDPVCAGSWDQLIPPILSFTVEEQIRHLMFSHVVV